MRKRRAVACVDGPLAGYAPGFRLWLTDRGYHPSSVEDQAFLMGHLSRWLTEEGLQPAALAGDVVEQFRKDRRETHSHLSGARGMDQLLGYLRGAGAVPEPFVADSSVERLIAEYREYLLSERGLVAGSIVLRERVARLFLGDLADPIDVALRELGPAHVTGFVVEQCGGARRGVAWAKTLTSGLRSLLVFLHVAGWVAVSLVQAVPSVAGWRLSSLPRGLEREEVARLLASCDRTTGVGRRDFAILMLLARLGLRACEVTAISLDDIDWRAGELTVHGKGAQTDRLPLPRDVGQAMVEHLLGREPDDRFREVFLRVFAPDGPLSAKAVGSVLRHACDRAGVPRVGTHRLRHTVATDLLAAGSSLTEIAPVLRHTNLSSTAIYAKVDRATLRTLARPWPLQGAGA
jgi:integrase/recombinase XerD